MVAGLRDRGAPSRGEFRRGPSGGRRGPGSGRRRFRLGLLIFTAVVLITLDFRSDGGGPLTAVRGVVADILGPVRSGAGWLFSPLGNAWNGITNYEELEDENARLRAELAAAESSILQVGELERERLVLFGLLNVQETLPNLPRVTARVIDAPVSNFERTVEIDRGSSSGIKVGMPVETGAGLIGRVAEVSATRAEIELLNDPNFDVGVRLVRSGDVGNLSGRGSGELLDLTFIELETVVLPGETVVTSGLDGSAFPEGMLVGTVVDVEPNAVQDTHDITVFPAAQFERLRWVSVVIYEPDTPGPVVVDREVEEPSVNPPSDDDDETPATTVVPPPTTVAPTTTGGPRAVDNTPSEVDELPENPATEETPAGQEGDGQDEGAAAPLGPTSWRDAPSVAVGAIIAPVSALALARPSRRVRWATGRPGR